MQKNKINFMVIKENDKYYCIIIVIVFILCSNILLYFICLPEKLDGLSHPLERFAVLIALLYYYLFHQYISDCIEYRISIKEYRIFSVINEMDHRVFTIIQNIYL
jgi:hypothetical protein